jgi:hypothetical protein
MNDFRKNDPEEQLLRLIDALDDEPPTEEEALAVCAEIGVDLEALHEKILAMVDAYEAGELPEAEEPEPVSGLRGPSSSGEAAGPDPEEPARVGTAPEEPAPPPLLPRFEGPLPPELVAEIQRAVVERGRVLRSSREEQPPTAGSRAARARKGKP